MQIEVAAETKSANTFNITVIYNGLGETVAVNPEEAVQALFEHSLHAFSIAPSAAQNLVLATEGGVELQPNVRVIDAGIRVGARLLLRPRVTRGG